MAIVSDIDGGLGSIAIVSDINSGGRSIAIVSDIDGGLGSRTVGSDVVCSDEASGLSSGSVFFEVVSSAAKRDERDSAVSRFESSLPHWGQKWATSRIEAPQVGQRREISGLAMRSE